MKRSILLSANLQRENQQQREDQQAAVRHATVHPPVGPSEAEMPTLVVPEPQADWYRNHHARGAYNFKSGHAFDALTARRKGGTMQGESRWQVRLTFALMLAFALVTGCEAIWQFANGNPLVYLSMWPATIAGLITGLIAGFTVHAKLFRVIVIVAALASICHWLFVSNRFVGLMGD